MAGLLSDEAEGDESEVCTLRLQFPLHLHTHTTLT